MEVLFFRLKAFLVSFRSHKPVVDDFNQAILDFFKRAIGDL